MPNGKNILPTGNKEGLFSFYAAMKHLFLINPCAGGTDHSRAIADEVRSLNIDTEIYITRGERDATHYVDDYCRQHPGEAVRFYACGGDGTLNEVVSGAIGHEGAEVTCYPCGSGNDYVKYFEGADFHNLKALTEAPTVEVDVMRVNGNRYGLNAMHIGFEAEVCRHMAEVRRKPLIGGKMTYTTAIAKSLAVGRRTYCRLIVDGEMWHDGDLLLASLANGRYVGGGYKCAPRSQNDDGLLEVAVMRPLTLVRFAKSIGYYRKGEHLDREKMRDVVRYRRAQRVVVENDRPFHIGIDGELLQGSRFEVENLHRALRFAVPRG